MSSWTTLKTWAFKETLSSSDMNVYLRDNMNAADAHPNGIYIQTAAANARIGNDLKLVFDNNADAESANIKQLSNNDLQINNPDGNVTIYKSGGGSILSIAALISGTTYGLVHGSDANGPYSGSYTNHVYRIISNNIERLRIGTDGTIAAMLGAGFRGWGPGGARWVDFGHNDSNVFINSSYGPIVLSASVVRTAAGVALQSYAADNTNYVEISQSGGSFGQIITNAGKIYIGPSADGQVVILGRTPRRLDSTSTYVNSSIQRGTGWIIGNGTASITQTVTFPVTFTSVAVTVVATPMGGRTSPTDESSFTTSGGVNITASVGSIGTTGFSIELNRTSGSFSGSTYYGYNWIAVGHI